MVGTFSTRTEADLAQGALEAAGIEAMVAADDAAGLYPGLWEGEGVSVVVNRENEREARDILSCNAKPME